jgi:hypothetical protein
LYWKLPVFQNLFSYFLNHISDFWKLRHISLLPSLLLLLTSIVVTPDGSNLHINSTQNTEKETYITKKNWKCWVVQGFCELCPGISVPSEETARIYVPQLGLRKVPDILVAVNCLYSMYVRTLAAAPTLITPCVLKWL